jgi:hypothetical protein
VHVGLQLDDRFAPTYVTNHAQKRRRGQNPEGMLVLIYPLVFSTDPSSLLQSILVSILFTYPKEALWGILGLAQSNGLVSACFLRTDVQGDFALVLCFPDASRRTRAEEVIKEVRRSGDRLKVMMETAASLFKVWTSLDCTLCCLLLYCVHFPGLCTLCQAYSG